LKPVRTAYTICYRCATSSSEPVNAGPSTSAERLLLLLLCSPPPPPPPPSPHASVALVLPLEPPPSLTLRCPRRRSSPTTCASRKPQNNPPGTKMRRPGKSRRHTWFHSACGPMPSPSLVVGTRASRSAGSCERVSSSGRMGSSCAAGFRPVLAGLRPALAGENWAI
jgi:hypothetical protein